MMARSAGPKSHAVFDLVIGTKDGPRGLATGSLPLPVEGAAAYPSVNCLGALSRDPRRPRPIVFGAVEQVTVVPQAMGEILRRWNL